MTLQKSDHVSPAGGGITPQKGWPHDPAKLPKKWPHEAPNRQTPASLCVWAADGQRQPARFRAGSPDRSPASSTGRSARTTRASANPSSPRDIEAGWKPNEAPANDLKRKLLQACRFGSDVSALKSGSLAKRSGIPGGSSAAPSGSGMKPHRRSPEGLVTVGENAEEKGGDGDNPEAGTDRSAYSAVAKARRMAAHRRSTRRTRVRRPTR